MSDLLDDILPVEPHPDVDMGMPPPTHLPVHLAWVEGYTNPLTLWVTPEIDVAIRQLAVLWKKGTFEGVFLEMLRQTMPSPNGSAYEVACFGCGRKFTLKRRPAPGRRSWCDACKASGEPAAQRARDYRAHKSGGE